jgi:hypothetical protein
MPMFRFALLLSVAVLSVATLSAQVPTQAQLLAAAKIYFRDSTEIPMSVDVVTTAQDPSGKVTKRRQSTIRTVFKGYNLQARRFSWQGHSGWFSTGSLSDSFSGDWGAFIAASIIGNPEDPAEVQVESPTAASVHWNKCHRQFLMHPKYLMPDAFCLTAEYILGEEDGQPSFKSYTIHLRDLPAPARLPYLGEAKISSYTVDGDFQKQFLPGDPKPYLTPGKVTSVIATDKGKITVVNSYALQIPKSK